MNLVDGAASTEGLQGVHSPVTKGSGTIWEVEPGRADQQVVVGQIPPPLDRVYWLVLVEASH